MTPQEILDKWILRRIELPWCDERDLIDEMLWDLYQHMHPHLDDVGIETGLNDLVKPKEVPKGEEQ